MATDLRPLRAFSIDKARNLFKSAHTALADARAPAQYVSAPRHFDAAYDCGLQCALAVLECSKLVPRSGGVLARFARARAEGLTWIDRCALCGGVEGSAGAGGQTARRGGVGKRNMESIHDFDVKDMPVTVAVSADGTSVHDTGPERWQAKIGKTPLVVA